MTSPQNTPQSRDPIEVAVAAGLTTADKLEATPKLQDRPGKEKAQALSERGTATAENLASMLSLQLNIPLIDLKRHKIQPRALGLVPAELARKHRIVPLDVIDNALFVVMANPQDTQAITEVANHTGMKIVHTMAIPDEVDQAIELNYKISSLSSEIEKELRRLTPKTFDGEVKTEVLLKAVAEAPIVRTVDLLVRQAVEDRASDIHIEPQRDRLRIRYRIDGVLHDVASLPLDFHLSLISRIKVLAQMDIADRRRPQDGQFSYEVEDKQVDIRTASFNTIYGEMAVLRILDKSLPLFALSELGLLPQYLERYQQMLKSPLGMVVVAGPTGAGKTTTLYASLNQLDHDERKIITVEDPVEYQFSDICPTEINPKAELTFASGLRAIMRLDPDVILIGEIRDTETAQIAVQAALTGHLVLSSIHANDAVGVVFRLLHLGIESFLLSSALIGVVAQRMVRRVCPHCSVLTEAKAEEKIAYQQEVKEVRTHFHYGAGCNYCAQTGYRGRTGVFEVLSITEGFRKLILTGASTDELRAQAIKDGMMTMRYDGMLKVQQGITTPYEVLRNVFSIGSSGENGQNGDGKLNSLKAGGTIEAPDILGEVLSTGNNGQSEEEESVDKKLRRPKAEEIIEAPGVLDKVLAIGNSGQSEEEKSVDEKLHRPKAGETIEAPLPDSPSLETYVHEYMPDITADLFPIHIRNLPELVWATILHLQGKHPKLGTVAQVTRALVEVGLPVLSEIAKGIPSLKALMDRAYLEGDERQREELLKSQFEVRISAAKLNKTAYCMSMETLSRLNELGDDLDLGRPSVAILALVAGMAQSLSWVPDKHRNKAREEIREFGKWAKRRGKII